MALVEIVATQEGVAIGSLDFEDAFADAQNRDVKRATAQVVNGDRLVFALLVQAISERSRGRLVDDAQDLEAGDLASILGGLALAVIEIKADVETKLGEKITQAVITVPA